MRRLRMFTMCLLLVVLIQSLAAFPALAAFPDVIPLPDGFRPEGIAVGYGATFYVGSIPTGAIYRGNLRTGLGSILVPGGEGRQAIGLSFDKRSGYLFVAGNGTGHGYAYDGRTGALLGDWEFTTENSFVNDVVVTRDAAYFTDSARGFFYRVPLGPAGRLPDPPAFDEIALGGDWVQVPGFNANGIDATPNGKILFIVQSATGKLFRVHPRTGNATEISLGGDSVPNGDGILLAGKTLYVVQNQLNQIAVVQLNAKRTAGRIVRLITDSDFDVPTTIAKFGKYLYAVNARFGTPPTPDTEYDVVQVRK